MENWVSTSSTIIVEFSVSSFISVSFVLWILVQLLGAYTFIHVIKSWPGMMVHSYNPNTQEAEAEELQVSRQLGLQTI
jgi:hypothetical protein